MLNVKAVAQFLNSAIDEAVPNIFLVSVEGQTLVRVGAPLPADQEALIPAVAGHVCWTMVDAAVQADEEAIQVSEDEQVEDLESVIFSFEQARLYIQLVHNVVLVLFAKPDALIGQLRMKVDALSGPLSDAMRQVLGEDPSAEAAPAG